MTASGLTSDSGDSELLSRRLEVVLVGSVLLLAGILRFWGLKGSIGFPTNLDEIYNDVQRAAEIDRSGLRPDVLWWPTAYRYISYGVFQLMHGFHGDAVTTFERDPGAVVLANRVVSAISGVGAVVAIWAAARMIAGRIAGLAAVLVTATMFLPVAYSHMSVSDSLAFATTALTVTCSVVAWQRMELKWFAIAGAAAGLAAGSKYTAGYALAYPLLIAALSVRLIGARQAVSAALLTLVAAGLAFVITTPYAVIDPDLLATGLKEQNQFTSIRWEGETNHSAGSYYGWTLTWGFGWLPLLAAAIGAVVVALRDRKLFLWLALPPAICAAVLFTSSAYFARYLMPVYPTLLILAGCGCSFLVRKVSRGRRSLAAPGAITVALLVALPGLLKSIHFDQVWSRPGTYELSAAWVNRKIPKGQPLLTEPRVLPPWWPAKGGVPNRPLYPVRYQSPESLAKFLRNGGCWVVATSFRAGRVLNEPDLHTFVPIVAYLHSLDAAVRSGQASVTRFSPYRRGTAVKDARGPLPFNFDWSYDAYPAEFERPGPVVSIYDFCNPNGSLRG